MAKETKITAETSKEELPSNVETLKSMVLTLLEQIDDLTGQLHYLKRQLFGKKSEKLDPAQRLLFEDMYEEVKAKVEQQREEKAEPVKKTGRKKKHNGRNPLPADLPRETIKIEPSEEEKICPVCNTPKEVIGSETTEVLEYVPAVNRRFKLGHYERVQNGSVKPVVIYYF
ncbi:Transposase [Limihaloglobus sulfuriphilus]|uniref:Transposase n=1 Tax=Limihaloglobus sulfuriphilus TaxID=1851148 RepID=A0A1Q2MG21_9BACT|nr:hypothetical protein [Limihaloglobus sulfuriphilus]AQQ71498.1 Transposase [Limihaloglobus sulfuriphilus]